MRSRPLATWRTQAVWLLLPCALGLAAVALAAGIVPATGRRVGGSVYTVAQVQAHLVDDATTWVGRTVRVRALAEPCPAWGSPHSPLHCRRLAPVLVDPAGTDLADPLPLVVRPGSPLLAALRRLPLAGGLLAAAPAPPWEVLRTYRVRLQAAPGSSCGAVSCFAALLLAVAPGAPGEG
jgi:hypothetical protein